MKNDKLAYALARVNYCAYTVMVHRGKWIPGRLHRFLCDTAQDFVERSTKAPYEILVLSVPPQHGKSQAITETLPSWYLGKYPEKRVIEISYNDDFAGRFGRRNKTKIEEFGWQVFGIKLGDKTSDREFELRDHRGGMISRGVMAGITGNPGDLIIIDDPIKSQMEADSPVYRKRIQGEWESSIKSRTQAGAKVIVIQTRWHESDLAGWLIQNEPNVTVINIPCEAEENDPLKREAGTALCPELGKDNHWLEQFKRSYMTKSGIRAWNALYQGRPSAQEGNMVKREWWNYYTKPPELQYTVLSVDAAFKGKEDSDFVAIQAWGKSGTKMYLLDAIKKHLDFPATIAEIRLMRQKYPKTSAVYIEDKANGPAAISVLRQEMPGVVAVNPEGGKVARVNAVSPAIEAGDVYLPEEEVFTASFVEEWAAFPNGAHDDQVDAGSQALNKLIHYFSLGGKGAEDAFPFNTKQETFNPLIESKINII